MILQKNSTDGLKLLSTNAIVTCNEEAGASYDTLATYVCIPEECTIYDLAQIYAFMTQGYSPGNAEAGAACNIDSFAGVGSCDSTNHAATCSPLRNVAGKQSLTS